MSGAHKRDTNEAPNATTEGTGMNERALARKGRRACAAAAAEPTFRPMETGGAMGAASTLRPAGRATSQWIRCRTEGITEGPRYGGREGPEFDSRAGVSRLQPYYRLAHASYSLRKATTPKKPGSALESNGGREGRGGGKTRG